MSWVPFEFKSADIVLFTIFTHLILTLEISPIWLRTTLFPHWFPTNSSGGRLFSGSMAHLVWSNDLQNEPALWRDGLKIGWRFNQNIMDAKKYKYKYKLYIYKYIWLYMLWKDGCAKCCGFMMVYGWVTLMGISTLNRYFASSYMVGLRWHPHRKQWQTMRFSIRRYQHQSRNDNITTCNTQLKCVFQAICFVVKISESVFLQEIAGKVFRSREPIGDISLVYLDLMKRKVRPKSNLKNGRWDWEIH